MRPLDVALASAVLLLTMPVAKASPVGNSSAPLVVKADKPFRAPGPADFKMRYATSPQGHTLGMNQRYLTLDGKPWLPTMGEFHYTRVPESEWEQEILKMKAAGVQIVSTYVFWIHQEEVEGQFDWSGRSDLRRFVELCAKHGLYVWLRIGPWDHGEVRNGGFPDWLLKKVSPQGLRRDDPLFMGYVNKLYAAIGGQVKGLMWNEGGPIIGVQLENEYSMRGPGAGQSYILALKKLAVTNGFRVPLYSVTGWDGAIVPNAEVVAVFGGYPDAPWDWSLHQLPPQEVYEFRFSGRASGNMGAMGADHAAKEISAYGYPFMTAEMGGGVQDTYHRRPVIAANDVAAMMPVMLGSGVNLYGTYMFQGGINPNGKLTTLQESQASGYPNDLPIKSYDFQAPLSAFGQERASFRKLKIFNYFLNDFGGLLAPMPAFAPNRIPSRPGDFLEARVAVRTDGHRGFLFFNNYARYYAMPDRPHFQVKIELPGKALLIPTQPVNLPSGDYGIWPFGLTLGCLHLRYATSELLSRTQIGREITYYFVATKGVSPEFVFQNVTGVRVRSSGRIMHREGGVFVDALRPSLNPVITATDANGGITRVVLLNELQAENAWKLGKGWPHLLLSPAQVYANDLTVNLQQDGSPTFRFAVVPPTEVSPRTAAKVEVNRFNSSSEFQVSVPPAYPTFEIKKVRNAGTVPPVKLGPSFPWRKSAVATVPNKEEFALAAMWRIEIPQADWQGVDNLFLVVNYDGDVARLTSGSDLLDDNFYNGKPWVVGLDRFRNQIKSGDLYLEILPRRADAPLFLERRYREAKEDGGQVIELKSVKLVPQEHLQLQF